MKNTAFFIKLFSVKLNCFVTSGEYEDLTSSLHSENVVQQFELNPATPDVGLGLWSIQGYYLFSKFSQSFSPDKTSYDTDHLEN